MRSSIPIMDAIAPPAPRSAPAPSPEEVEAARLAALRRYDILDTPPDGAFDRVTRLAARLLDVPVAIVSLVDADRIWFKSHHGLALRQIERSPGLCASAILEEGPYLIENAPLDPRTLTNPLVAGDFGLRFYAAVPLRTHDGHNLGTLCVLDFAPRVLAAAEVETLETLASVVMDQMELRLAARRVHELHEELSAAHEALRDQAAHDALTGLWSRSAILDLASRALTRTRRFARSIAIFMLDVDHFKRVNDAFGHPAGDRVLVGVADRIRESVRLDDAVGRLGGEELMVVLEGADEATARKIAARCLDAVRAAPMATGGPDGTSVTVSIGVVIVEVGVDLGLTELMSVVDAELYQAKRTGRDRVCVRVIGEPPPIAP